MRLGDKLFEGIGFVSPFPVERVQIIFSTEVPVVGSFTVNRTEQFKLLDDRSRFEIENFANGFFDFHFVHRSRPKGIDGNTNRIRDIRSRKQIGLRIGQLSRQQPRFSQRIYPCKPPNGPLWKDLFPRTRRRRGGPFLRRYRQ